MNFQMQEAILQAVIALANIPFAPQEPAQQDALMEAIADFADRPDALAWTVKVAVAKWNRWLGPAELRGIYCRPLPSSRRDRSGRDGDYRTYCG